VKAAKRREKEELLMQENPILLRTFINLWLKSQGLKAARPSSLLIFVLG
jgi:hypothetical protein